MRRKIPKVPQVMQMETLECGAACLAMILAYYGKWVPLEQLRVDCGVSRDGSRAKSILRAARSYGLAAKGYAIPAERLKNLELPCILYWEFKHYVVLKGFKGKYAYINDPARGEIRVGAEEFGKSFTGVVLRFELTDAFEPGGEPPSTLRFAKKLMRGMARPIAFAAITAGIVSFIMILNSALSQVFLDYVLPSDDPIWSRILVGILASLGVASGITSALAAVYLKRLQGRIAVVYSARFIRHLLHLPAAFYEQRMVGDLQQRQAVNKIKLAGAEDRAFAKWTQEYAGYARLAYNRPRILQLIPTVATTIGLLGMVVIYNCTNEASMGVANYMAFSVAYGQLAGAVNQLSALTARFMLIGPTFELMRPILESVPELGHGKQQMRIAAGNIEVPKVSFRYDEFSPYVVRDLSFSVRSGEYVGIVGKSGCGKSTIMRLLLGFETPERGAVYLNGKDISKVDLRSMRRSIGTVLQDSDLFLGSIFTNIAIANPLATLDDVWEAAELAGIADDIRAMPMGMQTVVTEGSGGLSGGQRQRLLIARAVCGNRKILLFDEATSALDNITQRHVTESLSNLRCTRIVVAHRLSTVRDCDRILLIDGGRVCEEGTYDELIAADGLFADLVRRQRLEGE